MDTDASTADAEAQNLPC